MSFFSTSALCFDFSDDLMKQYTCELSVTKLFGFILTLQLKVERYSALWPAPVLLFLVPLT